MGEPIVVRLKIDLHVHTIYSGDSSITLEAAIQAAKTVELDGLALTDHDSCQAWKHIGRLEGQGVLLIPGIEVSSAGGHILALGVMEPIPPGLPVRETVEEIWRKGGIAVAAHPLCPFKKSLGEEVLREVKFDAIETLNASTIPFLYSSELKRASMIAEELGLPQVGGSDSHTPETIGKAYTIVEADEPSVKAVLKAIKNGRCIPAGSRISLQDALNRLGLRLRRKLGI
ncbi:MAG: CehA/McbA family metallohydrolase [Candidatus Hecatellaceae archaeon]